MWSHGSAHSAALIPFVVWMLTHMRGKISGIPLILRPPIAIVVTTVLLAVVLAVICWCRTLACDVSAVFLCFVISLRRGVEVRETHMDGVREGGVETCATPIVFTRQCAACSEACGVALDIRTGGAVVLMRMEGF